MWGGEGNGWGKGGAGDVQIKMGAGQATSHFVSVRILWRLFEKVCKGN